MLAITRTMVLEACSVYYARRGAPGIIKALDACELGLNLKSKPKKWVKLEVPSLPSKTWSIDFMHNVLVSGRRFRIMYVIDDYWRECLDIQVCFSLPSKLATRHLDAISWLPLYYNGLEPISHHFVRCANRHATQLRFIQPGNPS